METARRACVESVGVSWGFRPISELRNALADNIVSSPSEILKLLSDKFWSNLTLKYSNTKKDRNNKSHKTVMIDKKQQNLLQANIVDEEIIVNSSEIIE